MNVVAIIQARTSSTRLPNKVLLDLEGKTVLERVIERVSAAKTVDRVVVATSIDKSDDAIEEICKKAGIDCYRGSLEDVLDRYYQAAKKYGADSIVRITADCPLMDPSIIDSTVSKYISSGADYISNALKETFPDGEDVEIFTFKALERAWNESKKTSEREHVTPYIRNNTNIFKIAGFEADRDLSEKRWTLDNAEDYEFLVKVYSRLYKTNPLFGLEEILELLKNEPDLNKINSHIVRNEGYARSLRDDKSVKEEDL
ncbi:MAG: glycosyltransferase family protein [Candidatus Saganbacteria bacterium]|nr:glycosyltransferase family protein [Candidatus Saganbacteria bacterium]